MLLLVALLLLSVAAVQRPRTEVTVRVNTPALGIEHRAAMAQEVTRFLNQANTRVTVTMVDRVIGAGEHPIFDKAVPIRRATRIAGSGEVRKPAVSVAMRAQKP
jgi:hypothetical protein